MDINVELMAELSKLSLEEGNLPSKDIVKKQMEDLIKQMQLPEIPLESVVLGEDNLMPLREDIVKPSLSREEALSNAPKVEAGCFEVPKTV